MNSVPDITVYKESKISSFIWNGNHTFLKNDLYVSGIINLSYNEDDDDNSQKKINLINLNDPNNSSISFNNNNNKWIIGNINNKFEITNDNNTLSPSTYLDVKNCNWFTMADLRLKNIIAKIDNNLEKINKIKPVYFSWKNDSDNTQQVGLIAQDVLKVFKEAVSVNNDLYNISYTSLIPLIIGGIQEADESIKNNKELLLNENNNLKDCIKILNNKVQNLEDIVTTFSNSNVNKIIDELINKINEQQKNININKNKLEILQNIIINLQKKST